MLLYINEKYNYIKYFKVRSCKEIASVPLTGLYRVILNFCRVFGGL
jgi:hypothetical protein